MTGLSANIHTPSMYDAIVVGLGGMGSASLFELARRGLNVLGIEQFDVPHDLGSSHGLTRIIRLAYFESPAYVPLLFRAYERWREIESCGEKLLYITGSIDAGREHSRTVQGSLQACHEFSLPHDLLDAASVNKRFPGYRLERDMLAIFQPQGGFLLPERCIVNYVQAARDLGAEIRTREKVIGWDKTSDGIAVRTASARLRCQSPCDHRRTVGPRSGTGTEGACRSRTAGPVVDPAGPTRIIPA